MRIFLAILATIAGITGAAAADTWSRAGSTKDAPVSIEVNTSNPFAGFYVGADVGGQFTDIAISGGGYDELFDGISADGLVYGAHAGFNVAIGRLVVGPYIKGGFADVDTTFADRELLSMQNFIQAGGLIGLRLGDSSLASLRIGYEQQEWEALSKVDVTASGWVFGGDLETLLSAQTSIGLHVDYVQLSDIEADGAGDLSRFLGDSEALRVTLGLTYRPQLDLPVLESLRR